MTYLHYMHDSPKKNYILSSRSPSPSRTLRGAECQGHEWLAGSSGDDIWVGAFEYQLFW